MKIFSVRPVGMRWIVLVLLLVAPLGIQAQNALKRLKEKAQDATSKDNRQKYVSGAKGFLDKARDSFDSTDFDYAILVTDNSGLFDVKEKGETLSKLATGGSIVLGSIDSTKSNIAERARFQLEAGELSYGLRKFSFADKRFIKAIQLYEQASMSGDIGYLKSIASRGLLYTTMGRFTQAVEYSEKALELRKAKFGEKNIGVASSLNNNAVLQFDLGRYNEAEKSFASAASIVESSSGKDVMQYAIIENNQAMLLQTIGRYEDADAMLKDAIAITEKLKDSKSNNNLKFLSNQALLFQQMKKYPEAEAIYLSMEKKLGKNNPDYASMLNNQAALYLAMGKEEKIEDLLKKSVAIFKSNFSETSPAYARAINDLGNFYRYKERYKDAEPLLTKALEIREVVLGKNHPLYVQSQEDIAILHWKMKAWDKAFMMYREVMDKSLDFITRYFPPMSEAEKTKYWDVLSPRFQRFYNFAVEANIENPHVIDALFDYHIATKALLLNSTNKVKQSILASKDAALIKDYKTWLDQKETLARMYAYSKEELKEQSINLDSIERASNAMEKKLSERSSAFLESYSVKKTSFSQIKNLLGDNEAVVEVMRLQKFSQKFIDDAVYIAMILTKQSEIPKLVILDNGQQLETRYSKYYMNTAQKKIPDEYSYDQYWSRIDAELAGKKLIYFSPDGVFSQLNVNTFRKPGGDYNINRYDIVVLGNSKDLIPLKSKKTKTLKKNATLIGFPDYGVGDVAPLPGTKIELDGISKTLKASGYQVTQLTAKNATETNLKLVKGPTILHIATHGYFLKDAEVGEGAFGVHVENAEDNPLLRSGLLLAGAASTVSGKRGMDLGSNDNGVLTAYEAMNLNLEGTDLIVISACETGLGEVKAGEGVYGLQRAFQVAGADALIMSLWKVDDTATQQLMTSFVANYIKLGNKQKAFRQAQVQLMTKYKEPYYWGAFVLVGM